MSDSRIERMDRLFDEATNAYEAFEYATALHKVKTARIIWDSTPDQEKDGHSINLRSLENLTAMIERDMERAGTAGEYKRVPITYGRPSRRPSTDGYDC